MHQLKKQVLCIGLGLSGLLLIGQGEINRLQCHRAQGLNCTIDRQRWFAVNEDRVLITEVKRAEIEITEIGDDTTGGRIQIVGAQESAPLTRDFVSADRGRRQLAASINRFVQSRDPDFRYTDLPLWTYLLGLGAICVAGLSWYAIPVSKFDKF